MHFQAAQYAQRESQELFQCLYFKGRGTDDENCVVDAVIFQLRLNGVFVFVPRFVILMLLIVRIMLNPFAAWVIGKVCDL